MNEEFKSVLDKPVTEWASRVFKRDCNVYVCGDGYHYINRDMTAAQLWDRCKRPAYLLKALIVTDVCRGKDYVHLIMRFIDLLLTEQGKEFSRITEKPLLLEIYTLLKENTYEVNDAFVELTKTYVQKLSVRHEHSYDEVFIGVTFQSLLRVYTSKTYSVEDTLSYTHTALCSDYDTRHAALTTLIKSVYDNPFATDDYLLKKKEKEHADASKEGTTAGELVG